MRGEYLIRYSGSLPNKYRKVLFETELGSDERISKDRAIELFTTLLENLQEEEPKDVTLTCNMEVISGYDGESSVNIQIRRDRIEMEEEKTTRLKKSQQETVTKELAELDRLNKKYQGRTWDK